jgi:hypothetical protein
MSNTCLACARILSQLRSHANHRTATEEYKAGKQKELDEMLAKIKGKLPL